MQILTGGNLVHLEYDFLSRKKDFSLPLDFRFVLDLFSERKAVTAWDPVEGESHLDTLLRAIVINRLGRAGDQVPLKPKPQI